MSVVMGAGKGIINGGKSAWNWGKSLFGKKAASEATTEGLDDAVEAGINASKAAATGSDDAVKALAKATEAGAEATAASAKAAERTERMLRSLRGGPITRAGRAVRHGAETTVVVGGVAAGTAVGADMLLNDGDATKTLFGKARDGISGAVSGTYNNTVGKVMDKIDQATAGWADKFAEMGLPNPLKFLAGGAGLLGAGALVDSKLGHKIPGIGKLSGGLIGGAISLVGKLLIGAAVVVGLIFGGKYFYNKFFGDDTSPSNPSPPPSTPEQVTHRARETGGRSTTRIPDAVAEFTQEEIDASPKELSEASRHVPEGKRQLEDEALAAVTGVRDQVKNGHDTDEIVTQKLPEEKSPGKNELEPSTPTHT